MKISAQNTTWMSLSCALAVLLGQPALADDTELLLFSQDPSLTPKSNVMFILDTSGSMTSTETTVEPYDSTIDYSGNCDKNNLYWSDVDVLPVCDGNETQFFDKSAFQCLFAANQIAGIGSFSGTMVQYYSKGNASPKWQYLEPGEDSSDVECHADSGIHGDGTPGEVYAASGSGQPLWTSEPKAELSWGSSPRNLSYTVFDGNYLNWKDSPQSVTFSRTKIMKLVTKTVLSSINNLNVGIMRFNKSQGGTVILGLTDLDTNRQSILDTIDSLDADGNTPLSETLYESALYWMGAPAYYGELINDHSTDPGALASSGPEVYLQPTTDSCAKNFNVLLTDGAPSQDDDGPARAITLPQFSAILGRPACSGSGQGHCLDDISEYLGKIDTNTTLDGEQTVVTHTIGFSVDLEILRDTALASGGRYFLADDVESLTIALMQIIGEINDRSLSFSAPAVSVNTFNRTRNLNDLYLTMFGATGKSHWPGNLKKYSIASGVIVDAKSPPVPAIDPMTGFFLDQARSEWTVGANDGNDVRLGGAANVLPNPSARNLFTNNGADSNLAGASNAIATGNSAAFSGADFGLTGAAGEPSKDDIINWMRGVDVRDEDNNPATTVRNTMGDPLHSQPAAIVYGGTATNPDVVVYTATNDGYLHAIDGTTGVELWSFVPKQLLSNMTRLYFDPSARYKQYGLDGNIVPIVKDVDGDGIVDPADGDFVYIIFGMRRGGTTFFALDVTDKNSPNILWKRSLADAGESWSTPVVVRMDINDPSLNSDQAVVVIGGGYDTVHDTSAHPATADVNGIGVHILDLMSGATIWHGGPNVGATKVFSGMTRAMPNQIQVLDMNGDDFADRMYASDLGGQIWRFDIKQGQTPANLVDGGVIAQLGAEGLGSPSAADTRRFYSAPDLSIFSDPQQGRRYIAISIGSGYRAHPFDLTASDRFFSVRDPDVFNQLDQNAYDSYSVVSDTDLVEISGQTQVVVGSGMRGWKFTLPANQKVLTDSITFDDEIFFVAFTPDSLAATNCSAGQGTNFLYRIKVNNGDPVVNNLDTIAAGDEDLARFEVLAQAGIASTPTILFPSPAADCTGAACSPPPIMCIGVECRSPGFDNNPVRTLWTQDGIN